MATGQGTRARPPFGEGQQAPQKTAGFVPSGKAHEGPGNRNRRVERSRWAAEVTSRTPTSVDDGGRGSHGTPEEHTHMPSESSAQGQPESGQWRLAGPVHSEEPGCGWEQEGACRTQIPSASTPDKFF